MDTYIKLILEPSFVLTLRYFCSELILKHSVQIFMVPLPAGYVIYFFPTIKIYIALQRQ